MGYGWAGTCWFVKGRQEESVCGAVEEQSGPFLHYFLQLLWWPWCPPGSSFHMSEAADLDQVRRRLAAAPRPFQAVTLAAICWLLPDLGVWVRHPRDRLPRRDGGWGTPARTAEISEHRSLDGSDLVVRHRLHCSMIWCPRQAWSLQLWESPSSQALVH